jgi:hypothetical protein
LQHVDLAKPAASAFCLPSASPEALFGPTGFASRPVAHAINDWIIPNGLKLSGIPRAGKRGAHGGWSAAGEANPEYSLPGTFQPHSQSISRRSAQGQISPFGSRGSNGWKGSVGRPRHCLLPKRKNPWQACQGVARQDLPSNLPVLFGSDPAQGVADFGERLRFEGFAGYESMGYTASRNYGFSASAAAPARSALAASSS